MTSSVTVWGDFEIHWNEVLGRGGMGCVYLARQRSLDRWVAVKVLDTSRAPDAEFVQGFRERFLVESRALAQLNDSRVVTILQAGENEGRYWYAMELIEGSTVEQRLFDQGAFPEQESARIGAEVARALDAALREGIIHRDVKPGNIFLCSDGAVKLGDFGLARGKEFAPTRLTDANALTCTPAYASPEQAEGRALDHRSDIYSLGCVLYEMATERPPFTSDSPMETLVQQASQKPPAPRLLNPKLSSEFEAVLLKCLAKDPEDRFQTYAEVIQALEPHREPVRSALLPAAAAAGATLFGVILVAIYAQAPTPPPTAPEPPPIQRLVAEVQSPPPPPPLQKPAVRIVEPPQALPFAKGFPEVHIGPALEDSPAYLLAHHQPAPAELEFMNNLLAFSRDTLDARSSGQFESTLAGLHRFDRAEDLTPWGAVFLEAERERVQAAARVWSGLKPTAAISWTLRDGRSVRGTLVTIEHDRLALEIDGIRETLPRTTIAPISLTETPEALAGAGDARTALARVAPADRPRHLPGMIDQAIEEALRAADQGDLAPLRTLDIPEDAPSYLAARIALLAEEREAARLFDDGDMRTLLLERPTTRAARCAGHSILRSFRTSLPKDDLHELVGEIPFGTWARDTYDARQGSVRFDHSSRTYVLDAPGVNERVWMLKPFTGARKGYAVRFRWSSGEAPTFCLALTSDRWINITPTSAALLQKDSAGTPQSARNVSLPTKIAGGAVTVASRADLIAIYLEDRLLFALPGGEKSLDPGLKIGAGGGAVTVESIRVQDRTR